MGVPAGGEHASAFVPRYTSPKGKCFLVSSLSLPAAVSAPVLVFLFSLDVGLGPTFSQMG